MHDYGLGSSTMTSATFSLAGSGGAYETASLQYKTQFYDYYGTDNSYVDISTDGGTSWNTLQTFHDTLFNGIGGPQNVDLNAYIGQTNCQLRFVTNSPQAYTIWEIDDLVVSAKYPDTCFTQACVCPTITVINPAVALGMTGTPFSQIFTATGGTAPYTFTTLNPLPAGITLASDGTLSGTPLAAGTFPITVTAADANGCEGSGDYSLVILQLPSTPIITSISDVDPCAPGEISIVFTAGTPATRHDLYRDAALVRSDVTSAISYNPGDQALHSYVIRAVNTDEACFADSAPVSAADTSGTPSQPVITGINDPDLTKFGLIITYTPGAPAVRYDLYKDGFLVVTGFASGNTYAGADNFFHQYTIVAVNGTCSTASAGVSARDMGTILRPKPRLPLEPLDFPR